MTLEILAVFWNFNRLSHLTELCVCFLKLLIGGKATPTSTKSGDQRRNYFCSGFYCAFQFSSWVFFHQDFCYLNTSHKVVTDSKGWNAGTCQRRSPFGINWRDFNLQKYRQGWVCSVRRLTFSIFFVANCVKKVSQLKVGKAAANYQVNLQDWTSGTSWQGIWGAQKNCFLPPKGLFQWMPNHCNAMHCTMCTLFHRLLCIKKMKSKNHFPMDKIDFWGLFSYVLLGWKP